MILRFRFRDDCIKPQGTSGVTYCSLLRGPEVWKTRWSEKLGGKGGEKSSERPDMAVLVRFPRTAPAKSTAIAPRLKEPQGQGNHWRRREMGKHREGVKVRAWQKGQQHAQDQAVREGARSGRQTKGSAHRRRRRPSFFRPPPPGSALPEPARASVATRDGPGHGPGHHRGALVPTSAIPPRPRHLPGGPQT